MSLILTDSEIQALLDDPKPITLEQIRHLSKPKLLNDRCERIYSFDTLSKSGREFRVNVSENIRVRNLFSIILSHRLPGPRKFINLIRCNGWHAPHPNLLEKTKIPANTCHIHRATERYMKVSGVAAVERFATETKAYNDLAEAVEFFSQNFGFYLLDGGFKVNPLFPVTE